MLFQLLGAPGAGSAEKGGPSHECALQACALLDPCQASKILTCRPLFGRAWLLSRSAALPVLANR